MSDTDLLVVGGGLAGVTLARSLRARGDARRITVLCGEPLPPYDRPPLSKQVLAGSMSPDDLALIGADEDLGIELVLGEEAVALDPQQLEVATASGGRWTAQDVVVATGCRARWVPPFADGGMSGVHVVRSLPDALELREQLVGAPRLVVVGAGFIGLEVAAVARGLGCEVTVLEAAPAPLTRVLGTGAGELIAALHRDHGVDLRCGVTTSEVEPGPDGAVGAVVLDDGTRLPADVVVVGVGVLPNTEWLAGSGVEVDNGVVCDGGGRASRPGVWAVGDVARWPNAVTGLDVRVEQWQAALDQAQVVAANLGGEQRVWDSVPYFWSDQYEAKLQFAGHPGARSEVLEADGRAVVVFGDGDRVTGLLTVTNPRLLAKGRRVIAAGGSWDELVVLVRG